MAGHQWRAGTPAACLMAFCPSRTWPFVSGLPSLRAKRRLTLSGFMEIAAETNDHRGIGIAPAARATSHRSGIEAGRASDGPATFLAVAMSRVLGKPADVPCVPQDRKNHRPNARRNVHVGLLVHDDDRWLPRVRHRDRGPAGSSRRSSMSVGFMAGLQRGISSSFAPACRGVMRHSPSAHVVVEIDREIRDRALGRDRPPCGVVVAAG